MRYRGLAFMLGSAVALLLLGSAVWLAMGVEAVSLPSGSSHRLLSAKGISSVAVSRDGNFLYLIAGGRLTTYEAASGTRIGSFGTDRGTILLVAGG